MGEQPQVLEYVTGATPLGGQVDAGRTVEQSGFADTDVPDSGRSRPAMQLSSVVLPTPDGPVIATRLASLRIVH